MNKPNEPSKATPLVEQIAEQFETRLENQGYLGITDNTPPEVTARIRRHVTNEFLAAIDRALSPYTETISNEEMDRIEREHPPAAQPQPPLVEQIADECFDNISSFIPEWRDNLEPKKWIRHFIQSAIEKGIQANREPNEIAGIKVRWPAAQPQRSNQICGCQDGEDCHICREPASGAASGEHDAELKADIDEARAQRDWLIKECARVGVTVNVQIGAPITEAYRLVNDASKPLVELLVRARPELSHYPVLQTDIDTELAKVRNGK